jgi:uncharacterized protein (DUF362 family)
MDRRTFLKNSALLGGATFITSQVYPRGLNSVLNFAPPDIYRSGAVDIYKEIPKLFDALGGAGKFVKQGNTVGMLVNSPWKHPGYYTSPDIPLAVAQLCLDSGASKVICFKPVPNGYWEKSSHHEEKSGLISRISYSSDRVEVPIEGGLEMKTAEIFRDFLEVDVFINIPVAKHHAGTGYSGTLKNLMGVSTSTTNRHMHSPDGEYTYAKQEYLSRCIADLNLLRKPDLCIVDAIVCGLDNGPRGPGETSAPKKILAGTDPLAMDIYAAKLAGFYPEDIQTFAFAAELGLGKSKLDDITVIDIDD